MDQTTAARRVPMVAGGGMQPQAPDIRMLLAKLEEERKARELTLPSPGEPAADQSADLVMPSDSPPPARQSGPMSADGVRRAIDARSQADKAVAQSVQTAAAKQRTDSAMRQDIAQSYGEAAAPRNARRTAARTTGLNVDPEEVEMF